MAHLEDGMKYRIGIDPGATGAIVIMDEAFRLIEWAPMPTMKVGSATRVNGAEVAAMLGSLEFVHCAAYLEQVGAMPGQGVASMFNFGHSAGTVAGVLAAMSIPVTLVTPQVWKKRAGIASGADKDAARSRAIQLWPAWRDLALKGKGQALADAALIARFG
jgi:crossover junction endodeoxyribonuclease RuvC